MSHVGKGLTVKSRRWRLGIREARWRGIGRPWRERDDRWGAREAGSSSERRVRGIRPLAGPDSIGVLMQAPVSQNGGSMRARRSCAHAAPSRTPNPSTSVQDRQTLRQTTPLQSYGLPAVGGFKSRRRLSEDQALQRFSLWGIFFAPQPSPLTARPRDDA